MSGFEEEQKKNQSTQQDVPPMMSSMDQEPGKGTLTSMVNGQSSSPMSSGLVSNNVCLGPDAPLVCAPTDTGPAPVTVPPQFDIPVTDQCMAPPAARNWSSAPPISECPMDMMTGGAAYKPEFAAGNLDTYKAAFNSSWSEVSTGYNATVMLNRGYKEKEKEVIPLLQVDPGRVVGAGVTGVDATKSFDGGKLKPAASKVDSSKLSPDLRAQIFKAKDKCNTAKLDIENKKDGVEIASGKVWQSVNAMDIAANAIKITQTDTEIANLQLDKEQVKRDLDQQKANIKVAVESAKLVTSIINCWSDPTKLFGNVIGAVNQGINAGGAIAEAAYLSNANEKLGELDGKIRGLTNLKGSLQVTNAQLVLDSAVKEVGVKIKEAQIAVRQMQAAKRGYQDAYRDMALLMDKAGAACGLNPKDRKALSGAVEALPKIEIIQQQLQGMDHELKIPQYSEESGIGAAMCSNVSAFTHALGTLKGNKEYVAEMKAIWDGRRASVQAVIDQSVSVAGDDSFGD